MDTPFSYSLLWNEPLKALAFFAFAMSFVSLWFKKTVWLWGSFLFIATALALHNAIMTPLALFPLLLLLLCYIWINRPIQRWGRLALFACISLLSIGLSFHLFPGFHNWQLIADTAITKQTLSYKLWLNFDKPFIGIFALALGIPLLQNQEQIKKIGFITLWMSLLGIALLALLSFQMKVIQWDPKIAPLFFLWCINNIIFVAIPEEAFFRGFFQKELGRFLGDGLGAHLGAIIGASLFFTLFHVLWVPSVPFLSIVFLAGVLYGTIYAVTRSIEASIFCHFILNLTHFLLFTYH